MTKSRVRSLGQALASALLVVVVSCDAQRGPRQAEVNERTSYDHGIRVHDTLALTTLSCSDGRMRDVGSPNDTILVTFSSIADCSQCVPHLSGVDALNEKGLLPANFLVVLTDEASRAAVERVYRQTHHRAACFDEKGLFWTHPGINHSPVTALVVGGVVQYLNDRPLLDAKDIELLEEDLARHHARPKHPAF